MPNYDHQAIRRAYPNVVTIGNSLGIFDGSGNEVTVDQAKIDEARAAIDVEEAALFYRKQRTGEAGTTDTIYLSIQEQLDMQYWDAVNGTTKWKDHITAVKTKYPKPT